ncbi:hypothetical protein JOD57_004701 [Geodermatophilus bullaregiensis]|uniref:hypothetical protein n=1 Tax=Geodermatophilus bullaregiensis TaxID=1564160 RepID=UPI00195D5CCA|nr:hypothetical protein [Geodermatophilus bullaregiensis]MBM7808864.1 hypothetical protein [Geodermatophilus bullaregiensis]
MDGTPAAQLQHLRALTGEWTTEGTHPLLPGEAIRGRAVFAWLEGEHFLVWRSHSEHPEVPDALAVIGVVDERLSMHYYDSRGVHRLYSVSAGPGEWRTWRDDPGFSQRSTGTFGDDGDTITVRGRLSRDGTTWEDDLALTYRRVR